MNIKAVFKFLLLILFSGCTKQTVDNTTATPIIDDVIVSPPNALFRTEIPTTIFEIIAGKQTLNSITLSILSYKTCDAKIEYAAQGNTNYQSISFSLSGNEPKEIVINGLVTASSYDYYYSSRLPNTNSYIKSPKYIFKTAKTTGSPFVMAITADSHLDMHTDTLVYKKTLSNILEENADFTVELGDTFMNDKYGKDFSMALYNYIAQRYFFGSICHSVPLYFVQGNHDGECGYYNDGSSQSWAAWSNRMRKKYFPMPEPDAFYLGNNIQDPFTGPLQNYYSWQWSNALFIVLDPFWYSSANSSQAPWDRTLGLVQYNWLKNTLATSTAKFKFVFIHHLVGGFDVDGVARGGIEAAGLYEWGGKTINGQNEFAAKRPGWEMPIHNLLLKYGVNVVFHGHDHFYDYQQLDGIIYQEVPQPSAPENSMPNQAASYGYQQGTILGGTGFLKLSISPSFAKVEYMGTSTANSNLNKKVLHQYIIN